eukprot:1410327-Prymnesium_polylepis.2
MIILVVRSRRPAISTTLSTLLGSRLCSAHHGMVPPQLFRGWARASSVIFRAGTWITCRVSRADASL